MEGFGAIDGGGEASFDVIELEFLDEIVAFAGVGGASVGVWALGTEEIFEAEMAEASEDPIIGIFWGGRERFYEVWESGKFFEFKGNAPCGVEVREEARAVVAHDLDDIIVGEAGSGGEVEEDGASGGGLFGLAFGDKAEGGGGEDGWGVLAIEGDIASGGEEEATLVDEEFDGVAIEEEAEDAGEPIAGGHLEGGAEGEESGVAAKDRVGGIVKEELASGMIVGFWFGERGFDYLFEGLWGDGFGEDAEDIGVAEGEGFVVVFAGEEEDGNAGGSGVIEEAKADGFGIEIGDGIIEDNEFWFGEVEAVEGIDTALGDKDIDVLEILSDHRLGEL